MYSMTLLDVCAELVREPFGLAMDAIMRLDRWTIQHVYFAPRDKDGRVFRRARTHRTPWERYGPLPRYTGDLAAWIAWATAQGWPEWYALSRWPGEVEARRAWKAYWREAGKQAAREITDRKTRKKK